MKITKEQIQNGVVIVYGTQQALVHNESEAEAAIKNFISVKTPYFEDDVIMLSVNDFTRDYIKRLFDSQECEYGIKTTNCGNRRLYFFPSLGKTLEEHKERYKQKAAFAKKQRLIRAKEKNRKQMEAFSAIKDGWYHIEVVYLVILPEANLFNGTCQYTYTKDVLADSKKSAYETVIGYLEKECIIKDQSLFKVSSWNSKDTQVKYLGANKKKEAVNCSLNLWERNGSTNH